MRAKRERTVTWWNAAAQTLYEYFVHLSLYPNYPSPQTCHHSVSSVFAVRISCCVIAVFVFRKPLFTVIMAPKRKISDAISASYHKSSRNILSISEKVKILAIIEIERIVCWDCRVVWEEQFFHSWTDEEQMKNTC